MRSARSGRAGARARARSAPRSPDRRRRARRSSGAGTSPGRRPCAAWYWPVRRRNVRSMLRLAPIVAALARCAGAGATVAASGWCRAPQPASWKRVVLGSVVSLSRHTAVLPIVGAGDGRSFFAELYSPGFSGVVRIDARTSRVTRIRRFPSARDDQGYGSFDGRWLVWNEYHSLSDDFANFTTFAWDSRSGRVTPI